MRVPIDWLSEYVEVDLSPVELSERLAMTGTEVARVLHHGPLSADNFVAGKPSRSAPISNVTSPAGQGAPSSCSGAEAASATVVPGSCSI